MAQTSMLSCVCTIIAIWLPACYCVSISRVTVTTQVGQITGSEENVSLLDGSSHLLNIFRGIPYALPPVGSLRFRKPRPALNFSQPFLALEFGPACPQRQAVQGNMSEDCLTLNIYAPRMTTENASFPVIVWIHGGAFMSGEGRQLPGENMAAFGKIVVVTLNFRVGALGFLATDDEEASGNFGLWDQRLALQWVKVNIADFGGDPGRVTLAGTTSGAFCVTYHALFPHNDGLFHRIIAESGTALSVAGFHRKGLQYARALADSLDCKVMDTGSSLSRSIVTCLRGKDYQDIVNANIRPDLPFLLAWVPVVDGEFIPKDPSQVVSWPPSQQASLPASFGSVDAMMGTTSSDGSVLLDIWVRAIAAAMNETLTTGVSSELFETAAQLLLKSSASVTQDDEDTDVTEAVTQAVLQEYSDWQNPRDPASRARGLVNLLTDKGFFIQNAIFTRNHAFQNQDNSTSSPSTFMYEFNQRAPLPSNPYPWLEGSLHKDQDVFVLGLPDSMLKGQSDVDVLPLWNFSKTTMTYWSNFVKTGNPNSPQPVDVEWPPFTLTDEDYLHLEKDETAARRRCRARKTSFWLDYIPKLKMSVRNSKASNCRKIPRPNADGQAERKPRLSTGQRLN